MAEFGWAYVAGGAITGAAGPTGSIQVKLGSTEIGGYPELVWNTGSNAIEISGAITASAMNFTSLSAGTGVSSKYLALDSANNVVLTSSSGGGGNGSIGAAEDGDYTDGLFTDFTTNTLIGVPVDRFNEVLKILAPSPAPALSRVNLRS